MLQTAILPSETAILNFYLHCHFLIFDSIRQTFLAKYRCMYEAH